MPSTRATDNLDVYLVGIVDFAIRGAKLPSIRQVLLVLYYNTRILKFTIQESASLVIRETQLFWDKARIPTRQDYNCVDKLKSLHDTYVKVTKNKSKKDAKGEKPKSQQKLEDDFVATLDNLFDIAHNDALTLIKNDEDRQFLLKQRENGRPGCMLGVDGILTAREQKRKERKEKENEQKQKRDKKVAEQAGKYY